MKKPTYWNKAKVILSKKDKVMKKLINNYKDGALVTRNDVFFSLCKSIIGQQISVAAANSVFSKFEKCCKGKINAKNVNKLSTQSLKRCGLSRQKVRGIKDLAKKIIKKEFKPYLINKMDDEEAILYLSKNHQVRKSYGKNSRKLVESDMSEDKVIKNTLSVYQDF